MKKIMLFALMLAAAVIFAACGSPPENKPANTANANTAKPSPSAPTKEALFEMDKKANEAYTKGDSKFFEDMLSDKFVMYPGGHRTTKADAVKEIADVKCDIKSMTFDDPQMATIDADTYVISYKTTTDGTCKDPKGKDMKVPSPVRAASVYVRNGEKWNAVFHGENEIVADASKPAADEKGASNKQEPKKEETKKPVVMEEPKKDNSNPMSAKMAAPASASNSTASNASNASNGAAPAKAAADPNTDALVKLHTSGWEAWKSKDAAAFDKLLTANAATVDPAGVWHSGKADVIKLWTTMDCKDVTKVNFKDGFASALSPTVEILTGIGSSDGTCDGHKNGDLDNVAFYVKEGSDWKMAFMFESMHGKM